MAEAVKPSKSKECKQQRSKFNESTDQEEKEVEKSDEIENLQKRLKSLTRFVNNLEPSSITESSANSYEKQETTSNSISNPLTTQDNEAYYNMIVEQAKQRIESDKQESFSQLTQKLDEINKINTVSEDNAIPVVKIMQLAPSAPHSTSMIVSSEPEVKVADFNLDKIRNLNYLSYPKLIWSINNQQFLLKEQNDDEQNRLKDFSRQNEEKIDQELMRFFEIDPLCKELEVYYKCKQSILRDQFEACLDEFVRLHSLLDYSEPIYDDESHQKKNYYDHRKNEFYEYTYNIHICFCCHFIK
jgi:hypothetical protein